MVEGQLYDMLSWPRWGASEEKTEEPCPLSTPPSAERERSEIAGEKPDLPAHGTVTHFCLVLHACEMPVC